MSIARILSLTLSLFAAVPAIAAPAWLPAGLDPENTLVLMTAKGDVILALRPDLAPNHVAQVKRLARAHFYDGVPFHRVIDGFMAQGGDPTGTGEGGSGNRLKAEFSKEPHIRGTLAMARESDPDTADSQFYICFADVPRLDGKYTVFGRVAEGMEFIDALKKGDRKVDSGKVKDPDWILAIRVAADLQ